MVENILAYSSLCNLDMFVVSQPPGEGRSSINLSVAWFPAIINNVHPLKQKTITDLKPFT